MDCVSVYVSWVCLGVRLGGKRCGVNERPIQHSYSLAFLSFFAVA